MKDVSYRLLPEPKFIEYGQTFIPAQPADSLRAVPVFDLELKFDGVRNDEGYVLTIDEDRIQITASGQAGLFYGRQTLNQILSQSAGQLRCVEIRDYPDIALRGAAIDFRFQTFIMDYLIEKIKSWAGYKINALMIDYGNNFPYSGKYAGIRSGTAFTEDEISRLVSCCKENFIEVIPCVQSFGHMGYILKNDDFKYLSEEDKFFSQICPLHAESLGVVTDLLTQAYAAHGKPRFLSIGGDETMYLGKCPRCQEYADKHGKGRLYIQFVNQITGFVKALGAKPVVYADIALANPQLFSELEDCVMGDWDYWTLDTPPGKLMDWSIKKCISPDGVMDNPQLATISHDIVDESGKAFYPFAYTKWMSKTHEVIGVPSTASTGPDDNWTPNYNVHTPNICGFAAAVKEYGALGMITTVWERYLMETVSFGIACTAQVLWSGGSGKADMGARYAALQYGLGDDGGEIVEAMHRLSAPYTLVEKKWPRVYVPELFGRGDISLDEIVGNRDIDANIDFAHEIFVKYYAEAACNRFELEQWLFGAKIKRFWRRVAAMEYEANTGGGNEKSMKAALDVEVEALKAEAVQLLRGTMPQESIERRIADSFANYMNTSKQT